jgi:hypothetical protein
MGLSEFEAERGERRMSIRRTSDERRYGERRAPERSVAGRRVVHVPDRRSLERRSMSAEFAV